MNLEEAAKYFDYCPKTGHLIWRVKRHGRGCVVGRPAGTNSVKGYRVVTVCGKKLYAHRVIWHMHYGAIPDGLCIDHIDGNGLNNLLNNLRVVTLSENQRNSRTPISNTTGYVCIHRNKHFYAVCVANRHIGIYRDIREAVKARDDAFKEYGFHENHGRKSA